MTELRSKLKIGKSNLWHDKKVSNGLFVIILLSKMCYTIQIWHKKLQVNDITIIEQQAMLWTLEFR